MWRRVVPVVLCGLAVWGCAGPADGPLPVDVDPFYPLEGLQ